MIIDQTQARDDIPNRYTPITEEEYIEIMEQKGFHFTLKRKEKTKSN